MCYNWQSYDVWFLRYRARRAEFFVILDDFLLFYPTSNPENQDFEEMKKKMSGDITILHKCTKINDHIPEIRCVMDVIFIFHFGLFFAFLPPRPSPTPTTQTIKILKIWKKRHEISSFYTCAPNIMITRCKVLELWCAKNGRMEKVRYRGGCPT